MFATNGAVAASAFDHATRIGGHARDLVAATADWLTHDTAAALTDLGAAAGIFVALSAIRRVLAPARRSASSPPTGLVRRVAGRTQDVFLAALSLELVSTYIGAPELLQRTFGFAFTITTVLQIAIWLRALALALVERRAERHGDASQAASAIEIVRLLLTVVIWTIAFILILDIFGVNVTGLIAGLGVGGIAIGLAAQGIFSDLFAALSIIFDRPFGKGDQINYGETWGWVEAIGLKTTRIRSLTGEQIVISNANLLGKELRNFARLERRRVILKVGIVYQTSTELASRLPQLFREIVEANGRCSLVRSGLVDFGASSLDYEVQFDVATHSYDDMYAERHRVMIGIFARLAELRIDFAYPTTVLFTPADIAAGRDASATAGDGPATPGPVRATLARMVGGS